MLNVAWWVIALAAGMTGACALHRIGRRSDPLRDRNATDG